MHNTQKSNPMLVLVRGVPGSGKSFFADKLRISFDQNDYIVLDPDATNYDSQEYKEHIKKQIAENVDPKLHPYRFLRAKAFDAIKNSQIIIWNQPFTDLAVMKNVTNKLEEFAQENNKNLKILVVELVVPKSIAWDRVSQRKSHGGHGPSEEKFNIFYDSFITAETAGYETISIDGQQDPKVNINTVVKLIEKLR